MLGTVDYFCLVGVADFATRETLKSAGEHLGYDCLGKSTVCIRSKAEERLCGDTGDERDGACHHENLAPFPPYRDLNSNLLSRIFVARTKLLHVSRSRQRISASQHNHVSQLLAGVFSSWSLQSRSR